MLPQACRSCISNCSQIEAALPCGARPTLTFLPFASDFNPGCGAAGSYDRGALAAGPGSRTGPWYDLRCQQPAPLLQQVALPRGAQLRLPPGYRLAASLQGSVCADRAFSGPCCLWLASTGAVIDVEAIESAERAAARSVSSAEAAAARAMGFNVASRPAAKTAAACVLHTALVPLPATGAVSVTCWVQPDERRSLAAVLWLADRALPVAELSQGAATAVVLPLQPIEAAAASASATAHPDNGSATVPWELFSGVLRSEDAQNAAGGFIVAVGVTLVEDGSQKGSSADGSVVHLGHISIAEC